LGYRIAYHDDLVERSATQAVAWLFR